MGAVTWAADAILLDVMPGSSLATQMLRLLITIHCRWWRWRAWHSCLRIREFGDARDLVIGRLRRMNG